MVREIESSLLDSSLSDSAVSIHIACIALRASHSKPKCHCSFFPNLSQNSQGLSINFGIPSARRNDRVFFPVAGFFLSEIEFMRSSVRRLYSEDFSFSRAFSLPFVERLRRG